MRKGAETFATMIPAHPALRNAAYGQRRVAEVDQGIIDATSAEGDGRRQRLCPSPVLTEHIQGQGPWVPSDQRGYFFRAFVRNDRQNRSKDFFLHDRCIGRDFI